MKHVANVIGRGGKPEGTHMHTFVSLALLSRTRLEILSVPYRLTLPSGASSFPTQVGLRRVGKHTTRAATGERV
jgi:hypothetical protein